MNYLDIIIILLLGVFAFFGLRKGLIIEAATLLGFFVGLYGAFHFSDFTANLLVQHVEMDPKYLNVISFAVTFVVLSILVYLLGRLVSRLVKAVHLGFLDKIGGVAFGIAKGVLLCSLALMLLNALQNEQIIKEETKQKSLLYPYVEQTVPYVYEGFSLVEEAVKNLSKEGWELKKTEPEETDVTETKETETTETETTPSEEEVEQVEETHIVAKKIEVRQTETE
jgi:membrane protein required for colicin V production